MTKFELQILVKLKRGVLDPQGKATAGALGTMGFEGVSNVRIGKVMDVWLEAEDEKSAIEQAEAMCEKLLANTVIEDYEVDKINHV